MSHIDQVVVSKVIKDNYWEIEAEDFTEGDFERLDVGYGVGIGIAATSRQGIPSFVEYSLTSLPRRRETICCNCDMQRTTNGQWF